MQIVFLKQNHGYYLAFPQLQEIWHGMITCNWTILTSEAEGSVADQTQYCEVRRATILYFFHKFSNIFI